MSADRVERETFIETVEPPHRFAYRWAAATEAEVWRIKVGQLADYLASHAAVR